MSAYLILSRWVRFTNDGQTLDLGVLPGPCLVLNPFLIVKTGFDSSGTDLIRVGTDTDDDAFGTDVDVSSAFTTPQNFTPGVGLGYFPAGKKVQAKYLKGGTAPSQGEALIILPYLRIPTL